ncbi:YdeI/OmpD-associated family protein [Paenibacillus sp. MBLB4367]|uniref:YdeI/OmpD-associated family protein n=1 Tax=Paenibacillus sp. MBLB4367 TaxID=3384767 RepID=UPI003908038D
MSRQRFEVKLFQDEDSSGIGLAVPFDVRAAFGTSGQIKVRGTINGHPFRSSIHPYGGIHYMGINKAMRETMGVSAGDVVAVEMERDDEPRKVELPEELRHALSLNEAAKDAYERLSYTNQKEYAVWVASAKKQETRDNRIRKALERLAAGLKVR